MNTLFHFTTDTMVVAVKGGVETLSGRFIPGVSVAELAPVGTVLYRGEAPYWHEDFADGRI